MVGILVRQQPLELIRRQPSSCPLLRLFPSHKMLSKAAITTVVLAATAPAYAWWRVACTDPLVSGR